MGEVLKRWNIPYAGWSNYPKIEAKRPQSIAIGFEWEVQTNEDETWDSTGSDKDYLHYNDFLIDKYSRRFADLYRFRIHGECMAAEFCSPVAQNLETIKAVARRLQRRVSKDRYLDPDYSVMNGIHVHTSIVGADYWAFKKAFDKAQLMLNRASSADFVSEFSRRDYDHDYRHQAESTCWDEVDENGNEPLDKHDALAEAEEKQMLRANEFDTQTIEYRIWDGVDGRLQPALEFAHACTKYVAQHEGDDIPYLSEFKIWLFKQKGYKFLKSQPEWALVK